MHFEILLTVTLALTMPGPAFAQLAASPLATDSGLIAHLKQSDPVLRQSLRDCKDEVVTRHTTGQTTRFIYRAVCRAKVPPSEVGDCHYRVEARGTVDSPTWATVRRWRLDLECSA
jgi:hypothetical protein